MSAHDERENASVTKPLNELTRLRLLARLVARYGLNVGPERADPPKREADRA